MLLLVSFFGRFIYEYGIMACMSAAIASSVVVVWKRTMVTCVV